MGQYFSIGSSNAGPMMTTLNSAGAVGKNKKKLKNFGLIVRNRSNASSSKISTRT